MLVTFINVFRPFVVVKIAGLRLTLTDCSIRIALVFCIHYI